MKKYLLLLLFLGSASLAFGQQNTGIKYFKGNLQDFQVAAKDKRIPSLLYLHGDNDAQQILYDKRVMSDTAIVKLVDTTMMAYQMNLSDDYNVALHYQLEDSPVLIVFDPNGWEIARLYGYKKVSEIVAFLKQALE